MMTYYLFVVCVLGVHTGPVVGENLLFLVTLEDHPMAQCNDGTPAVYYRKPLNTFQETRKVLIYLQGGGFCVPYVPGARYLYLICLEIYLPIYLVFDCEERCVNEPLLCTAHTDAALDLETHSYHDSIFSTDPGLNPAFHDYEIGQYAAVLQCCSAAVC